MEILRMSLCMYWVVITLGLFINRSYCKWVSPKYLVWPYMKWWQKLAYCTGSYLVFLVPVVNIYLSMKMLEQINQAKAMIRRTQAAYKNTYKGDNKDGNCKSKSK